MYIVMFGAPGSGKGTTAKVLAQKANLTHISTGEIFREHIKRQTKLGILADTYISKGNLVPDEVTIEMMEDRLLWEDVQNGAILDGFPRTLPQADALDKILKKQGKKIDLVTEIKVPNEIIIQRILNRQACSNKECGAIYNTKFKPSKVPGICDLCGSKLVKRDDDNEQTIKSRLKVYENTTRKIIKYYKQKNLLFTISPDDPTSENATQEIVDAIMKKINN